ncbi:MAG TPA: hypothetical protein VNE38_15830 [Ktedonobacteraceae bacterium]|nr:hypothetical protein [Ktedonobacteraceae bacterium]
MDEAATTIPPDQQDATTNTTPTSSDDTNLQQAVRDAAALGWAMSELLGRCYSLPEEMPPDLDWSGDQLNVLQETYTPREKLRALVPYIHFLADALGLSSCTIDDSDDLDNSKRFVDVLEENIKQLCGKVSDLAEGVTHEKLRSIINKHLFFWDLHIHDTLQNRPTVVPKAYLVGRTLAALRWYIGLRHQKLDDAFLAKICQEYIPMLQPYVAPYASGALANSVELWWKAFSSDRVQPGTGGQAPLELQKQADIWFSLLTNERNPLSFVPPALEKESRRFTWKVLQLYWPLLIGGTILLLLVLAFLVIVIVSKYDLIARAIAGAAGFIAALGITQALTSKVGDFIQKATTEVTKGSVINNLRESAQQQAVNRSTCILPGGVNAAGVRQVR